MIKPGIKEKLIAQKDQALMSKKLATIKRDMDIELDLEKCAWGDYDKSALIKLFRELEFYSLIKRVEENEKESGIKSPLLSKEGAGGGFKQKTIVLKVLDSDEKLDKFLEELKKQKKFVFKIISSGDNIMEKKMERMIFSWEKGMVYCLPIESEVEKDSVDPCQLFPPQEKLEVAIPLSGGARGGLEARSTQL